MSFFSYQMTAFVFKDLFMNVNKAYIVKIYNDIYRQVKYRDNDYKQENFKIQRLAMYDAHEGNNQVSKQSIEVNKTEIKRKCSPPACTFF